MLYDDDKCISTGVCDCLLFVVVCYCLLFVIVYFLCYYICVDTACCKNARDGKFYVFNDENVRQASTKDLSVCYESLSSENINDHFCLL